MFLKATPKQQTKYLLKERLKSVPINWSDFVALTTIRSGKQMLQFIPYEYQRILVRLMETYNNIVIVKSRQMGTTQAVTSKFLHDTCLNPASSSVAFMRNGDDVGSLSRRIKQMLLGLREYVTPENDHVGYLKLKGFGDFYIKNSSREGTRSLDSVTNLLFDESAFILRIADIYAASSPSSALAGDAITKLIVSTPSAKSGWYWERLNENNGTMDIEEICRRVAVGELYKEIPGLYWWIDEVGSVKLVLHWLAHPIYAEINLTYPGGYLAYRQSKDGTDDETIAREYNLQFINSATSVFTSELVSLGACGNHEEWVDPDADYFLGLDTSTDGADYCVAYVLKLKDGIYSEIALYRKRQQTSEYHLSHISDLILLYRPAKIGIEVTGGVGTLYLERLQKQFKDIEFQAIHTSQDSKNAMISAAVLLLEKEVLKFPSNSPVKSEFLSFQRTGKQLGAANGQYDDTVMALAFAVAAADSYHPLGFNFKKLPRTKY
jgi:Terminase RNaseH-like domain